MNPAQLGPKVNAARHGTSDAGAVVMDQAASDKFGGYWARLRVGEAECTLIYGSDDALMTMAWHGFIRVDGIEWRVSIDPETWVLTWHECLQRVPV